MVLSGEHRGDAQSLERADAEILRRRNMLLHHTRRLLPALAGDDGARDYRVFAEWLVGDVYLQDLEAIAHPGCDPLICSHAAHERG